MCTGQWSVRNPMHNGIDLVNIRHFQKKLNRRRRANGTRNSGVGQIGMGLFGDERRRLQPLTRDQQRKMYENDLLFSLSLDRFLAFLVHKLRSEWKALFGSMHCT